MSDRVCGKPIPWIPRWGMLMECPEPAGHDESCAVLMERKRNAATLEHGWASSPASEPSRLAKGSDEPGTEWRADSARGKDGSIGVCINGEGLRIYVDVLPDGRASVYVGTGTLAPPLKFREHLPSPPPLDDDEI